MGQGDKRLLVIMNETKNKAVSQVLSSAGFRQMPLRTHPSHPPDNLTLKQVTYTTPQISPAISAPQSAICEILLEYTHQRPIRAIPCHVLVTGHLLGQQRAENRYALWSFILFI